MMAQIQKKDFSFRQVVIKNILSIFLPVSVVLAVILGAFYRYDIHIKKKIFELQASDFAEVEKYIFHQKFKSIRGDLLYLSDASELKAALQGRDFYLGLAKDYRNFSMRKRIYDQVRYLDQAGVEVVRVNYKNGSSKIVLEGALQDKSWRYYFPESMNLNKEEIYVSPLGLNIEEGEIEKPLKPMIRFATPVFDSVNQRRGIIVLNYLASNILEDFAYKRSFGFIKPILLNSEGYYLKALNPQDEWGFMNSAKKERTFGNDFPEAWGLISKKETGQLYTPDGLFVFTTMVPFSEMAGLNGFVGDHHDDYFWKIVAFIPRKYWEVDALKMLKAFAGLYVVLIGFLGVGVWLLSSVALRQKEVEDREQEAIEMKLNFISMVSHELRSPLAMMKEAIGNVLDGVAGEIGDKQRTCLKAVNDNILRLNRLATDVLDFQKAVAGKVGLQREVQDINEIVRHIEDAVKEGVHAKGLELIVQPDDGLPKVVCDRDKIIQVLMNIVGNALKFTDRGHILITTRAGDNHITVSVYDTGPGLSQEELSKLFQEFYQTAHTRDKKIDGSGLGLAIAKQIIDGHNGKIWAESSHGKGTTFRFTLPLMERRETSH